jgi:hypothetical protein
MGINKNSPRNVENLKIQHKIEDSFKKRKRSERVEKANPSNDTEKYMYKIFVKQSLKSYLTYGR